MIILTGFQIDASKMSLSTNQIDAGPILANLWACIIHCQYNTDFHISANIWTKTQVLELIKLKWM